MKFSLLVLALSAVTAVKLRNRWSAEEVMAFDSNKDNKLTKDELKGLLT